MDRFAMPLKIAGLHRVNISLDTTDPVRYAEITRGGDILKVFSGIEKAKEVGLRPIKLNCVINKNKDEPDAALVKKYARDNGLQVRYIHLMDMEQGYFKPVVGGDGGNCNKCNRLRLTSDGFIKPCLFSEKSFSVRELGAETAMTLAVENKPFCGSKNTKGTFYNIGG
jgi:cyclic pyranopterin phosphate synthase